MAVVMMVMMPMSVNAAGVKDVFDAKYYASIYPDLQAAFGNNEKALLQHYLTNGLKEGRIANPTFNLVAYRNGYADLQAAFGDNWDAYANHYLTCGKAEGRTIGTITAAEQQTKQTSDIYNKMIALKPQYPEGMHWTNDNYYLWQGYINAHGCVAFACILSDAAFGTETPFTEHRDFNNVKVGDIIRLYNDTHSAIVLEVQGDSLIIAEGNYNKSIHWGRKIPKKGDYIWTRY